MLAGWNTGPSVTSATVVQAGSMLPCSPPFFVILELLFKQLVQRCPIRRVQAVGWANGERTTAYYVLPSHQPAHAPLCLTEGAEI